MLLFYRQQHMQMDIANLNMGRCLLTLIEEDAAASLAPLSLVFLIFERFDVSNPLVSLSTVRH